MPKVTLTHPKIGFVREYNGRMNDCKKEVGKWKFFYGKKFNECEITYSGVKEMQQPQQFVYRPTGDIFSNIEVARLATGHSADFIRMHLKNNFKTIPPNGRMFHYLDE
jgi:hypothetical protein